MNEVLNAIASRYSCRAYDGRPVEQEKLECIAKAGLNAPSARNSQAWKIKIITNKSLIEELDKSAVEALYARNNKETYDRIMQRGGKVFYNAPCMVLVLIPNESHSYAEIDCGIVTQNMALAATSLGLDNIIVAMAQIPFDSDKGGEFKKRVGWDSGYKFGMGLLVGYGSTSGKAHEIDLSKVDYY